ncbi:hypothetical protein ACFOYW_05940 [Gryllotalpicola reticulitermitis]|uniref:DNA mismatch repair proteins mutS family domain-containing protein n=1 Tax=Gryllotalpicola reticulitermitis TaxID=1184153 RepID=A0ABV8Q3D6_9MICO
MTDPQHKPADFRSILFPHTSGVPALVSEEPSCFHDLNLDQIVATLTSGRDDYRLEPIFYTSLTSTQQVEYRQQVYADLARDEVHAHATAFAQAMTTHRSRLAQLSKLYAARQKEFWLLSAMLTYQHAVRDFAEALAGDELESSGMQGLRDWLQAYVAGPEFTRLAEQGEKIRADLDAIRFTMLLDGLKVTVTPYADQADYSAEVEATFARFRQGEVKDHLVQFRSSLWLDTVEENTLELVAKANPETFAALDRYVRENQDRYVDPAVADTDRGLQFYLSYLEHTERVSAAGLSFTMPRVTRDKASRASDVFDLALADKLVSEKKPVVTNSFHLEENERVIVVTGANQGGKTTFSRTFGQLHWLANLGLPVPGTDAALFLFDQLFTHYEKEEDITTLHGKLEDELVRIHDILQAATGDSIIVMNEIFNSTTLDDAILLGTAVLQEIIERDILALCVTFIDELTTLSDTTVSMVAAVDPAEPATRTFKLERRPADGLAYAVALAEKYGLTHDQLTERIAS